MKESNFKKYETNFISRFEPIKAFHSIKDEYLTKMRKNVEEYTSTLRSSCEKHKEKTKDLNPAQNSLKTNNTYDQIHPNYSTKDPNLKFKPEERLAKKLMPFSSIQPKSVQNTTSKPPYSYFHASSHSLSKGQNESSDRTDTQSTNLEYEGVPQCKHSKLTVFVKRNEFVRERKRYSTKSLKSHKKGSDRHRTRSHFESGEFGGGIQDRFRTFEDGVSEIGHLQHSHGGVLDGQFRSIDHSS